MVLRKNDMSFIDKGKIKIITNSFKSSPWQPFTITMVQCRGGQTFLLAGQIQKVRSTAGRKKNDYTNLCLLALLNPYVFIQNWV